MESSIESVAKLEDHFQIDTVKQQFDVQTSSVCHKVISSEIKVEHNEQLPLLLPSDTHQGKKINLRLLQPKDQALYISLFSDKSITQFTGGVYSNQQALENFNKSIQALKKVPITHITWLVEDKETLQPSGIATLTFSSKLRRYGEIGVMLTKDQQDKGIGSSLLQQLIDIAFNRYRLKALLSYTSSGNHRVEHILKKGKFEVFEHEKLIKHSKTGCFWRLLAPYQRVNK